MIHFKIVTFMVCLFALPGLLIHAQEQHLNSSKMDSSMEALTKWIRPHDNNAFTTEHGNNHDAILFVDPKAEYPYYLIISHTPKLAYLWRAKSFSTKAEDWELLFDQYKIANHYEYDDGIKVGDTYYIYEAGKVYTYTGDLADSHGKWKQTGTFPKHQIDDVGVWYEDGVFHLFGEHGHFPHGPDGTSLAHMTSKTGLGDWTMINPKAVDPNPDGSNRFGVGDATLVKFSGSYYLFCDREEKGVPYRVIAWKSDSLYEPFEYLGIAIAPRPDRVDTFDGYRVQDADIEYVPELGRFVIVANMLDTDGNPGPGEGFPTMGKNMTRVIGVYCNEWQHLPDSR